MTNFLAETMIRKQRITDIFSQHLNSTLIEIDDESHKHHVPEGQESHFNILIVSEDFSALSKVARHRIINKLLADELKNGLHALSLHLYTPNEWETAKDQQLASPNCRGGSRSRDARD